MAPRYEPPSRFAADSAIVFGRSVGLMRMKDSADALASHEGSGVGQRGRLVGLLAAGTLIAAACSGGSDNADPPPATRNVSEVTTTIPSTAIEPGATPTAPPQPLQYSIEWQAVGDKLDAGTITVPLDYADPQGETIELYLVRHRADDDRVGLQAFEEQRNGRGPMEEVGPHSDDDSSSGAVP